MLGTVPSMATNFIFLPLHMMAPQPQAELQANVKPAFVPPLSAWRGASNTRFFCAGFCVYAELFCRNNVPFMSSRRLRSRVFMRLSKTVLQTVTWVMSVMSWDTRMGRCHLRSQRWSLSSAKAASAVTACWSTFITSSDLNSFTAAVMKETQF